MKDPALFGGRDAGYSAAEGVAGAQPDLDEDQRPALAADQVEFAATAAVIAGDDLQSVLFEEYGRLRFAAFSGVGRGIVALHFR